MLKFINMYSKRKSITDRQNIASADKNKNTVYSQCKHIAYCNYFALREG